MKPIRRTKLRLNICLLFISLLLLGGSIVSQTSNQEKQPNILLLVADDLAYADLGCYGGDIETPNLDRIATRGIPKGGAVGE